MTVSTSTAKSGPYAGSGTTGPFTVTFRFLDNSHLRVIRTVVATGVETELALTTGYTVTGAGASSGTVTLVSALAVGETLTILRNVPATQEADYVVGDAFPAESHETALDKLTMLVQQSAESIDRSLRIPASSDANVSTELPPPDGNFLFGWNEAGTAIRNVAPSELAMLVAYGTAKADVFAGDGSETDFDLQESPASLNNLDVSVNGVTFVPGVDYQWTDGTTVTFTTAPPNGSEILIRYMQGLPFGTVDSSDVRYTLGQTGAVATSVQAKLRETVSVFDFMTASQIASVQAGDEIEDVIVPINNAIAASDNIYFPPGTYSISTAIVCNDKVGFTLLGAGAGNTIIKLRQASSALNCIELTGNTALYTVKGMKLDGNSTSGVGLYITSTTLLGSNNGYSSLEFLYVDNCDVGYWVRTASEITFYKCQAWNAVKGFWASGTQTVDIVLDGCGFFSCTYGIQNISDALNEEAEIQLFNVNFNGNTSADIRTNYVSRWMMNKVFTEGSNRFMYVHNAGTGQSLIFNIQNLYVNTITAPDNYVIYSEQEITLILTGCNFTKVNQKIFTTNATRLILCGNLFVDPSPLSGLSAATKVTFSNEVFGSTTVTNTVGVKARLSANLSVPDATETLVPYSTDIYSDLAGLHDASGAPGVFTVPVGLRGVYEIIVTLTWAANVTGKRIAYVRKNSGDPIVSGVVAGTIGTAVDNPSYTFCTTDRAADGDIYEVKVVQTSGGGALNLIGNDAYQTTVTFQRVGA